MRDQFWNFMFCIKFYEIFSRRARTRLFWLDTSLSILLAVIGSGSVAAWLFWSTLPTLWAAILMGSQVLQIARPYLPFSSRLQALRFYIPELTSLFTDILNEWNCCEELNSSPCAEQLHELRKRFDVIDNRYFGSETLYCRKRLAEKLTKECDQYFVSF